MLISGRTAILQCLVDTRKILSTSGEFRYILNDLYITDYCLWIQQVAEDLVEWLKNEVDAVTLDKDDVHLHVGDHEFTALMRSLGISDDESLDSIDSDDF